MKNVSRKLKAVFGSGNIERVRRIVRADKDSKELAKISPAFIVMDLTWRCNNNCYDCIDGNVVNKLPRNLPVELIEDIFDYSKKHGVRGIMIAGGEAFLYEEGIKRALEKSIETQIPIKTVTNGTLLEKYMPLIQKAYKIPGSILRVSINADKEHYKEQTRSEVSLEKILYNIRRIASQGTPVYVSTTLFPEESREHGAVPNFKSIEKIISYCADSGAKMLILIPARDTETRKRYNLNDEEKKIIAEVIKKRDKGEYGIELGAEEFTGHVCCEQNLEFKPCCPSGFIFTLVGSDGRIYKCTDNRGKEKMVLGKIEKPGDFEKFWHSEERVEMQKKTKCQYKECIRYRVNSILDSWINEYSNSRIDLTEDFNSETSDSIFI